MANEFFVSAGLLPTEDSAVANTFYLSAGLVPDDEEETPTGFKAYLLKIGNHIIGGGTR
jgi:hypothetical protein